MRRYSCEGWRLVLLLHYVDREREKDSEHLKNSRITMLSDWKMDKASGMKEKNISFLIPNPRSSLQ